jgi:hypothetical protein
MWAKASISPPSELAREAGEAQPVGEADRPKAQGAARRISEVGDSLRDVQMLAGHASLSTTAKYIEHDADAQRKVVALI